MAREPVIICLTPVRNESWILDRFLRCASLWADHIIIADQGSTDGSREIASRFPKVMLVENQSHEFSEAVRQRLLLDTARSIEGPRLLIALDADEIFTSNLLVSDEWNKLLRQKTGTVIKLQLANVLPNMKSYWAPDIFFAWGFVDDGSKLAAERIHSVRVPVPYGAPIFHLNEIKVLHYQYTDWNRMKSKHRWYQCWERINNTSRHAIDTYRQYHHMYAIPETDMHELPPQWFAGYEARSIDMTTVVKERLYWWDEEVLKYFNAHGTRRFRQEAIWDVDWDDIACSYSLDHSRHDLFSDPRTLFEKGVHYWLEKTQPISERYYVRFVDAILKKIGW